MKLSINVKCSDMFSCTITEGETTLKQYDGYVPDFMPDEHFGDYVILDIDVKTGKILNWDKKALAKVKKFITRKED